MAFVFAFWRAFKRKTLPPIAALVAFFVFSDVARAEYTTFRTYDAKDGLTSLGSECMAQDRGGYILVCTENGVFVYNGRSFVSLGIEQGLRQGGFVHNITLTADGRVVVEFGDEVMISDSASGATRAPSTLMFHSVLHPGIVLYEHALHRLVPWQDGVAILAGEQIFAIVTSRPGTPRFEPLPYTTRERQLLAGADGLFSLQGHLWESLTNGAICAADPGRVRCYGSSDGLGAGPWRDVAADATGRILARSSGAVATLDDPGKHWSMVDLPDQGGHYLNYPWSLGLFKAPDGSLITQAEHGLLRLEPSGWRETTVEEGAPSGVIATAMTDATGQLWFDVFGHGLVRYLGYGHWQTFGKADGLSDGLIWQTARAPGGPLWVSTDTGIDEIVNQAGRLKLARSFPGGSFVITDGPHGQLWRGYGDDGARMLDPATGVETRVPVPAVNSIVSDQQSKIWLGTQRGLFLVDEAQSPKCHPTLLGSPGVSVASLIPDRTGGILYLARGRLRRYGPDGRDVPVPGVWPGNDLDPIAMAFDRHGDLWIGGGGGLYRFSLALGRVTGYEQVPTSDTRTNGIVALMIDHRGWVWVGTSLGVAVYDGKRWVSVDANSGLVSDDVDQAGLREDPDGSVWITTSQGLSHLLDPAWLFVDRPVQAVISDARLGDRPLMGGAVAYTRDAMTVQFGTPNYGAERSVVFHYMLSGVDDDWAETASGLVRYAFVPPGRHELTVVGIDTLTHRSSIPATLLVDVAYPWWRQWWAETLWVLGASALVYGAVILRFRTMLDRQARLQRLIAEATEQLRHQAAHDSLTGLLNRFEIERVLAARLAAGPAGDELMVALVDLDHFKQVNDVHGHLAGDEVLRQLGSLLAGALREGEQAGRYGGEEMLLIIDNSDGHGARRVQGVHEAVRAQPFDAGGTELRVTCSIGLAWAVRGDDWESLIGRADRALYDAKDGGRDQVVESGGARTGHARRPAASPWHDAQSGLANRALFELRLTQAFETRGDNRFALLLIELEQLREGDAQLPGQPSDGLLRLLADRLGGCVRQRDTLARLGGLSFAIVQHGVADPADAERLALRLLGALDAPFVWDGSRCEFAASIGIAMAPDHGEDAATLTLSAEAALSRVRQGARHGFHVVSHEQDTALLEGQALGRDLQDLRPDGEMELFYQPIVVIQDGKAGQGPAPGRVVGFEALLRWNHPTRGLLMPGEFIALSEENGSIERLGAWIMMRACTDAASWPDEMKVAINVSASQFRFGTLPERLSHALTATGIRPGRVELEITETALLPDDEATLDTLQRMQALGVQLALDDFGTGFSSLSYLRSFPFDRLKIDRSFVMDLCQDEDAAAIVRAIIALGRSLDISVTAEGVETSEQLERLREEGCTQAQGYLFGRPAAAPIVSAQFAREPQGSPAE